MSIGIADEVINAVYNFVVKHIEKINTQHGYDWDDNKLFADNKIKNYGGTAIGNLLEKFETSGRTPIERTLDLRAKLHSLWCEQHDSSNELENIAKWYIKDWGGINGNGSYEDFVQNALRENTNINEKIPSYSKLMAIVDPKKYAILDARVCFSLHVIQFFENVDSGKFLKFKNLETQGIVKFSSRLLNYMLPKNRANASYQDYLNLLKAVVDKLKSDNSWNKTSLGNYWNDDYYIQIVEMVLFWQAKNLAEKLDNYLKTLLTSNDIKSAILKTLQN